MKNINKYFELKLATVLRDKEEKKIPKSSTLNKKIQIYLDQLKIVLS